MNLNYIIKNLKIKKIKGSTNIDISSIIYDSREAVKNSIFVCLRGSNSDGHKFIDQAIKAGAVAIIVEKNIEIPGITIIEVENTRSALAFISANFFSHPSKKIKTIAITGTKGKTTTSFMIKSILETGGNKVGLIGTLGVVMGKRILSLKNTTPESYEIQKYLNKMVENNYDYVVIEASSIGLAKNRLDNILFDVGIFTNMSHDHIGENEHKNFEEYLNSKSILFQKCQVGFINTDDKNFRKIIENHTCKIKTFSLNSSSDYYAKNLELINKNGNIGINFSLMGKLNLNKVFISIPGKFNVYNSLAAAAVCDFFEVPKEKISLGLSNTKVKGRFELIPTSKNYSLIIDYAHNATSMENILKTLKEYNPKRIVVLFGAGGNRPKIRRYEMGEVCGNLSDFSVITSDNPRFENPMNIIKDIEEGIKKTTGKYIIIPDRKEAIKYCIENSKEGDVIVFAGKGHEEYQEINGIKLPFNEREIIFDILKI